jgi:hypothetical protein
MPELTPFGETLFDASDRAIVAASFLNNPSGGCVASDVAVTCADQRRLGLDPRAPDFAGFDLVELGFANLE